MIPVRFYAADIFSFAHHAWASETASVSSAGGESGEAEADISWFRSELARLRFDLQGKPSPYFVFRVSSPYFVFRVSSSYFVLQGNFRGKLTLFCVQDKLTLLCVQGKLHPFLCLG
jgi:hypothetical protein